MPGKAALIFGLLFWFSLPAQNLNYSRAFPSIPKNGPLLLHNTSQPYFFVLRYNRKAHDLTLERRAKPSAEILSFTPLKLDSVNSDLYNYASMDYLLYEHKNKLYFVFEKTLNNTKSLYFKCIDSLGKASGFTEMFRLNRDNNLLSFELEIAGVYDGKLLVVASQEFVNQTVKKTIHLYDPVIKKQLWSKTLPLENSSTGYSKAYCLNEQQDLFYVMVKRQAVSFKRQYIKHTQLMIPVFHYDSLHLCKLSSPGNQLQYKFLLSNLSALHSLTLRCDSGELRVLAQVAGKLNDNTSSISLFTFRCNIALTKVSRSELVSINPGIKNRLTYYDGTDFKEAADKEFQFLKESEGREYTYHLTERKEGDVYKELLLWQIQKSSGKVSNHYLIPRRMLSSETWSKYRGIGEAGSTLSANHFHVFMAEASANVSQDPNTVEYYQLKKKSSLSHCYLVVYTPENNGNLSRMKLHLNLDFDFIPVDYSSTGTEEIVFYLSNGKQEKFAIYSFP